MNVVAEHFMQFWTVIGLSGLNLGAYQSKLCWNSFKTSNKHTWIYPKWTYIQFFVQFYVFVILDRDPRNRTCGSGMFRAPIRPRKKYKN